MNTMMKVRLAVGIQTKQLKTWKPGDHVWVNTHETYVRMRDGGNSDTRKHVRQYTWFTITASLPRFFGSKVVKGVMEDAETTTSR